MAIELVELSNPHLAYIILGGFTVVFYTVSSLIKDRLYINEVLLGTVFGIFIGPHGIDLFNPHSWGVSYEITLEVMRVVLGIGLFKIGVDLPNQYMYEQMKSLLVMIVPTMAIGWAIIAGFLQLLFPQLNFISCLAISACLTPTDPIICAAIVEGSSLPDEAVSLDVRHLLSAESAANDGLAFPFLTIALYLTAESAKTVAFEKWFLIGCLYQVILGTIIGAILGAAFSHLMKLSLEKKLIKEEAYLAQQLALPLLIIGIVSTIGSDDLLAAFAAGSAFSWNDQSFRERMEYEAFASIMDSVLNCACFIYIGAWLPFEAWHSEILGINMYRLLVLFIAVIFLRRIPALLMLYKWVPKISNWKDALFCGHFGPMGVSAVFVSSLAISELPVPVNTPQNQAELLAAIIQPIVSFVVLGSIIVHGLSVMLLGIILRVREKRTKGRTDDIPLNQRGD